MTQHDATDIIARCDNVEEYVNILTDNDAVKALKTFIMDKGKGELYEIENPAISDYTDGTRPHQLNADGAMKDGDYYRTSPTTTTTTTPPPDTVPICSDLQARSGSATKCKTYLTQLVCDGAYRIKPNGATMLCAWSPSAGEGGTCSQSRRVC